MTFIISSSSVFCLNFFIRVNKCNALSVRYLLRTILQMLNSICSISSFRSRPLDFYHWILIVCAFHLLLRNSLVLYFERNIVDQTEIVDGYSLGFILYINHSFQIIYTTHNLDFKLYSVKICLWEICVKMPLDNVCLHYKCII